MNIIEKKRSSEGEFFVNLFEWCNMNCSFCWQDHNKWDGIETIVERSVDIVERVKKDYRTYFVINLMGGELFADQIPDTIFEDYKRLVQEIKKNFPEGKTFHINWVTNFVYTDIGRVIDLVETTERMGISNKLTTSFDFAGRFAKGQKEVWENNVYLAKKHLGTISVVLTRPNIEKMIKTKDETFEKLYREGFYFYFDYYSPEKGFKFNAPSDKTLQDGLIFLQENYPNTWPIKGWVDNEKNEMTCRGSMIVDHTGYVGQCRALLTKEVSSKMASSVEIGDNKSMEQNFVNKYDCVSCEFFHKCGMGCFLQHDFKGKDELGECLYKEVFRRIENGG